MLYIHVHVRIQVCTSMLYIYTCENTSVYINAIYTCENTSVYINAIYTCENTSVYIALD